MVHHPCQRLTEKLPTVPTVSKTLRVKYADPGHCSLASTFPLENKHWWPRRPASRSGLDTTSPYAAQCAGDPYPEVRLPLPPRKVPHTTFCFHQIIIPLHLCSVPRIGPFPTCPDGTDGGFTTTGRGLLFKYLASAPRERPPLILGIDCLPPLLCTRIDKVLSLYLPGCLIPLTLSSFLPEESIFVGSNPSSRKPPPPPPACLHQHHHFRLTAQRTKRLTRLSIDHSTSLPKLRLLPFPTSPLTIFARHPSKHSSLPGLARQPPLIGVQPRISPSHHFHSHSHSHSLSHPPVRLPS